MSAVSKYKLLNTLFIVICVVFLAIGHTARADDDDSADGGDDVDVCRSLN